MTLSGWLVLVNGAEIFRRGGGGGAGRRVDGGASADVATLPGWGEVRVTRSLNFLGDTCLRTNLLTKRALAYSEDGDVIEIITDNPSSAETIPFMSSNYNSLHLATVHAEQCWKIYLRKGKA